MHLGKTMRKALSVLLSAAMIFGSSAVSPVMADLAPGGGIARSVTAEELLTLTGAASGHIMSEAVSGDGQTVSMKFDLGQRSGVATGFKSGDVLYKEETGYGLKSIDKLNNSGNKGATIIFSDSEEDENIRAACNDFSYIGSSTEPLEFLVDVVAGEYEVTVYSGATATKSSDSTYSPNKIYINDTDEGNSVICNVTKVGEIAKTEILTFDKDGQIVVKATNTGGRAFVNAIVITGTISTPSEYTVSYDAKGGSGSPSDPATYEIGEKITVSSTQPTKANSIFLGWSLNENATSADDVITSVIANRTSAGEDDVIDLYAVWVDETKYKVEYVIDTEEGEGGTTPTDSNEYIATASVTLANGTGLTKSGYLFDGWTLTKGSSEKIESYAVSADDADENKVIKFYPVWTKAYTISYDKNGGSGTVPQDTAYYKDGATVSLQSGDDLTKEGFKFVGWALTKDATSALTTYKISDTNAAAGTGVITLYAVWQAEGAVNLKFDIGSKKGTAEGFIGITNQSYDSSVGYGFTNNTANITYDKQTTNTSPKDYVNTTGNPLIDMCWDYAWTSDESGLVFKVDVPAGTYDVSVYAGVGGDFQPTIYVNEKNLDKVGTSKLNDDNLELFEKTTVVALAEAGSIVVTSKGAGSAGRNMLNGIIIKNSELGPFPSPQNVSASSSATSVTISWDAVADADHYNIFRKAPSGRDSYSDTYNNKFYQIGSTEGTSFTDPVVTCNEYEYYVVAVGSRDGKTMEVSDPSETVTSTVSGSEGMGNAAPAETYSDRALVAAKAEEGMFVSWRLYEADSKNISFTLKRNGETVYTGSNTSFMDAAGKAGDSYTLTASEGISTGGESTVAWAREYQEFTLQAPESQTMPDGSVATYTSNDMSVGDLDGDGQLELIVKWYPSNAQDNSNDGYTGTTILDAYDIDIATGAAELMWRIDLGLNIRSGAHYTQFQVWDFDGDGKAELICKTADGTTTYDASLNETGHVGAVSMAALDISAKGKPEQYDFRQHEGRLGRIVLGDEYLTAFDGETGEIIDTVNYVPFRGPYDEKTGIYDTTGWGLKNGSAAEKNDGYANRCDRFLSAIAYIDNGSAAAIFSRGYYDRTAIAAWKLVNGKLAMQWVFDTPDGSYYAGQGNHGIGVNDVDGDGLDEIIFAGLVLNSDGTPRVNTQWRHGDAMHISDWDGDGQLEVYKVNEEEYGAGLYNPDTGEIEWFEKLGADTGRGVAADVDPRYSGAEMWHSVETHTHSVDGEIIYYTKPSQNFSIFWDGDLLMELFDSNSASQLVPQVQKWDYHDQKTEVLLQADGTQLNNGTKGNAGLIADIYGDWREEIIVQDVNDNNKIRIYTTTIETAYSFPCFLEDTAYREGVAWQNVGYNQPANVTYLLSNGVKSAVILNSDRTTSTETLTWEAASDGKYGHGIGGYQIYRAESADAAWADYVLAGEVDGATLSFTDTGLKPNTEYTYVVAAVIDGKVSYKSLPFSAKTALATSGVQAVEPITLVQDAPDYETAFPATVVVTDTSGKQQDVDITWDYSTLKIETPGEKTVYGTIYGREEKVPVQVTVLANKITAVESLADIYTLQGVAITLPGTVKLSMYNNVEQEAAVTWNNNYDINILGAYEVTGTCASSYGEEVSVKVTVHVAEDYIVSVEQPAAVILDFEESAESVSGKLPATVNATFAKDGRTEAVPVTWSSIDTTILDTVTIDGIVANYAGYAKLLVKVDYPTIKKFDFGLNNSPVEDGWIGVQAIQKGGKTAQELDVHYTPERGYGFEAADGLDGRNQSYTQEGLYSKAVYNDFLIPSGATNSSTFMVDVENGEYIVEMISGSTDKSTIKVDIEGKSYSIGNAASAYEVGRFEGINVTDGQLTMEFTAGNLSRVCAVIVHKVVESQNTSETEAEKITNVIGKLPNADAALTPYDVTRIDKAAEMTAELDDADKDALTEEMIEKLDALYAKAHNLTLEVKVDVPAEVAENKALEENAVSAKGMATASGAKEGVVALDIVQQKPTIEPSKAQIQFKASLTVNAREQALHAPVIITIELPSGVNVNNLRINHYTDDGKFVGTIYKGNSVSSTRYVLNGRTITFRTNSFSIFSLVSGSSGGSSSGGSSSDGSSSGTTTIINKPAVTAAAGEWKLDATGWWYSYKSGGYAANKWENIAGKWYYFKPDGYMKTGWVNTDGIWYFCKADGAMADAEWIISDGKWYYLNAGGAMAANTWILYNNKWYYLNADGSMRKGWLLYKNNWYFLKNDGEMAADETTPDGYKVDKDGIWR